MADYDIHLSQAKHNEEVAKNSSRSLPVMTGESQPPFTPPSIIFNVGFLIEQKNTLKQAYPLVKIGNFSIHPMLGGRNWWKRTEERKHLRALGN